MAGIADEEKCVVKTNDGPVCGYIERSDDDIPLYKFKSIPYAKPPLGSLRFLAPAPIESWTEIKDCTKDSLIPYHYKMHINEISGTEDCLYLEITTPNLKCEKPLPVMFWIGCYYFSCNIDHVLDPTLLIRQEIIFVRCGFRLGPFGFLSVHDVTAPGNSGLKDIVMALKWVQRNISAFGGNPHNVTLFGSSAGGAIVHLMMLSPMATGLFHKAIIQSACALNNWSLSKNPFHVVEKLAKALGINKTCKFEIVDELKSIPAEDILYACLELSNQSEVEETNNLLDALFKPCIEIEFEGQPAFLSRSPLSIIKSGKFNKVPFIIGSNYIEAQILQYIRNDFYEQYEKVNKNMQLLVPKALVGDAKQSNGIGHKLLKFYLGGEEQLREETKVQHMQLIGDYYFLYYVNKTLRLHSQYAPDCPIYYYIVNHAPEWDLPNKHNCFNSVGHTAELSFIFRIKKPNEPDYKGSRDSKTTRSRVVKMWTNFSKYGNPTPEVDDRLLQIKWDPVENKDKLHYLSIGSELTKGINPFQDRMAFWDKLHEEYKFLRVLVYFNDLGIKY